MLKIVSCRVKSGQDTTTAMWQLKIATILLLASLVSKFILLLHSLVKLSHFPVMTLLGRLLKLKDLHRACLGSTLKLYKIKFETYSHEQCLVKRLFDEHKNCQSTAQ